MQKFLKTDEEQWWRIKSSKWQSERFFMRAKQWQLPSILNKFLKKTIQLRFETSSVCLWLTGCPNHRSTGPTLRLWGPLCQSMEQPAWEVHLRFTLDTEKNNDLKPYRLERSAKLCQLWQWSACFTVNIPEKLMTKPCFCNACWEQSLETGVTWTALKQL